MDKKFSKLIQNSAKGSAILVLGQLGSTLILALGSILIARILQSTNYGIISIAMAPVNLAALIVNNGVSSAVINMIAQSRYTDNEENIKDTVLAGFLINTIVGFFTASMLFFLSGYISRQLFEISEIEPLIKILSLSILAQAVLDMCYAVLVGFERMIQRSTLQIVYSIVKSLVGPILVYLGYGVTGAALGYTAPFIFTALLGLFVMYITIKNLPSHFSINFTKFLVPIILFAYPLLFSTIIQGGLGQVFNLILPFYVSASDIGNYYAANNFSVLVGFFLAPLSVATFPLLSKINHKDSVFEFVFQNIIKYETMLVFPMVSGIIALSDHMVQILYGSTYPLTPLYLRLLMINFYFVGLGSGILANILNSQKETGMTFRRSLIYLLIGFPLGFILIPRYGIIGLQITQLIAPKLGLFYILIWIKRNYKVELDYNSLLRISLSTIISFSVCTLCLRILNLNLWMEFLIGGCVLVFTYIFFILITGALTRDNLEDMQNLMSNIKFLKPVVSTFFTLLSKLARY